MSNAPKFGVAVAERLDLAALERAIPDLADIPPESVPEALARRSPSRIASSMSRRPRRFSGCPRIGCTNISESSPLCATAAGCSSRRCGSNAT